MGNRLQAESARLVRKGPQAILSDLRARNSNLVSLVTEIARSNHITVEALLSDRRSTTVVWARSQLMHRLRGLTRMSLAEVGEVFGMHHSSVHSAIKYLDERAMVRADPVLKPLFRQWALYADGQAARGLLSVPFKRWIAKHTTAADERVRKGTRQC